MSARILIVDDTPLNVKLLEAKLAKDYYFVSTATSGPEALEIVQHEMPDLILLDVMMPEMDGFEVCTHLKENIATQHIPIIIITALSDIKDRVRGLECGANDFLTKPFNDTALFARVRSLLRLKMITDEWRLREATAASLTEQEDKPLSEEQDIKGNIIILEDNASDRAHLEKSLKDMSTGLTLATDLNDALQKTQTGHFDLAMVSLDLAEEDGLRLCGQLRAQEPTRTLPILLLANENEIEIVAKGLDLGANDYLIRPIESTELVARVRTQLQQKKHYDRLRKKLEQSLSLALVDPLTGAYNRRYLDMHLPTLFERCQATNRPLSVLSLDLDHFKKINDTYGHSAGDFVLKETINRLQVNLRASDLVVRMGGEEFAVLMPETEIKTAQSASERLRRAICESTYDIPDTEEKLNISASFGVVSINHENDTSPQKLLDRADSALYRAKEYGRNKVVSENEMCDT
ncbi:MAG TPA: PleD family two-component system response regulator [Rhodospirillaceae bacterium]|nr:PleD family two-component system response regulator [Rhodospirillaceae bacterium]